MIKVGVRVRIGKLSRARKRLSDPVVHEFGKWSELRKWLADNDLNFKSRQIRILYITW